MLTDFPNNWCMPQSLACSNWGPERVRTYAAAKPGRRATCRKVPLRLAESLSVKRVTGEKTMNDSLTANGSQKTLMLSDGVYIYYNGADELRLRKGIWNFEEAILTFDGLSKDHKESLVKLFTLLQDGRGVDTDTSRMKKI